VQTNREMQRITNGQEVAQEGAPELRTVTPVTTTAASAKRERRRAERRAYVQLGALLSLALIAVGVAWVARHSGGKTVPLPPANGIPAVVSRTQLQTLARSAGHPIYWAGPKKGAYELTRTRDGRIYIRYLSSSADVGDPAPSYLTVGTYPTKTAFVGLRRAAKREGAVSLTLDHGGLLVINENAPKNVYFGYPGAHYQVEVYGPSAQRARALVLANKVKPIS
jgi:hypothetical protein